MVRKARGDRPWQEQNSPSKSGKRNSPGNRSKKTKPRVVPRPGDQEVTGIPMPPAKSKPAATRAPPVPLWMSAPTPGMGIPDNNPFACRRQSRPGRAASCAAARPDMPLFPLHLPCPFARPAPVKHISAMTLTGRRLSHKRQAWPDGLAAPVTRGDVFPGGQQQGMRRSAPCGPAVPLSGCPVTVT